MVAVADRRPDRLAISAWPGLELATLVGPDHRLGRARRTSREVSSLDAPDRRLARAGIHADLAGGVWVVRCGAYGERTFASGDGPTAPPADLLAALAGAGRGAELRLAVRARHAGRVLPVVAVETSDESGAPLEPVGQLVDEDLSVLDGRRVVSRQRYVTVEGTRELIEHVRRRLAALGMGERVVDDVDAPDPLGPPDPVPWALESRPPAAAIVQRALARSVARLLAHDPVVRLDLHVEGVHQMRVATRRLRSDLRTFAEFLGPLPDGLSDDLGWLARTLGEVRDPDVLRERLVAAIDELDPADRRATTSLVKRLVRERDAALDRLHAALDTARYHDLVRTLVGIAEQPPLLEPARQPAADVLRPAARRAWERLRKAAKTAGREGAEVADVHEMRIRAKRFRYALDALADVEPAARAHAERLADLQDVLGELNDAVVAEAWLRGVAAHESDPRRMFVLGQLVMSQRLDAEQRRAAWPAVWEPVRRRKQRAWLDR